VGLAPPGCRRVREAGRVCCKVDGMNGDGRAAIALGCVFARSGNRNLALVSGKYTAEVPLKQRMTGEKDQRCPRYRARHLGITVIETKADALGRCHGRHRWSGGGRHIFATRRQKRGSGGPALVPTQPRGTARKLLRFAGCSAGGTGFVWHPAAPAPAFQAGARQKLASASPMRGPQKARG